MDRGAVRFFLLLLLPGLAGLQLAPASAPLPQHLSETGLYADLGAGRIAEDVRGFTPQYPLWSDGSLKQRWIRLPPGASIDASKADAWQFPPGTRLWKEFSMGGRVETRLIERQYDGRWRYATYVWKSDGSDAELAPENGIAALPVAAAPQGKYRILAQADCRACHEAAPTPVLGFSALQLSPDRDRRAANAVQPRRGDLNLRDLARLGLVSNLDPGLLARPPRIRARNGIERAALGYLHGNCGHCHNRDGAEPRLPLDLDLAQRVSVAKQAPNARLLALARTPLRYRNQDAEALLVPGQPEHSLLYFRLSSRNPQSRMPPLGTVLPDPAGLALVGRWLRQMPALPEAPNTEGDLR